MAAPTCVLGSFSLTDISGVAYGASVIAQGTSKGSPVPIDVAVNSWLQDGSISIARGYDNRTVTIRVKLRAPTAAALGAAEAALHAELRKPNTLTWTPSSGPAAVFVVVNSSMDPVEDDTSDLTETRASYPWRRYDLRLTCEATVRSLNPFTSVGTAPGGATTTNLDACAATTGWTGFADGASATVTNSAGPPTNNSVSLTSGPGGGHSLEMQKTFAATTSTTNLLMVDWQTTPGDVRSLTAIGDGAPLLKFAEGASPTVGYTRTWFKVGATTLAVLRLTAGFSPSGSTLTRTLRIDNVAVTNVAPISGTNRQQLRAVTVPGSARTPGSLSVESATAALGDDVMVYVYPPDSQTNGYSPPLRQFRSSGNTVTPDSAQVSGNTEPLTGSPVVFQIPVGQLPRGSYLLMGRLATSGGGTPTISYAVRTVFDLGITPVAFSGSRTITTTAAYQVFALGRLFLPATDLGPLAGMVAGVVASLTISASSTCTYDEFWLYNTTIGQLIWVDCGTGSGAPGRASRRLFIEPATVETPRPTVRVGHSADRSDSFYPGAALKSWQFPQFKPSQANVLAVTPNATDAVVSLSGYARWHTNPGS